MHVEIIDQPLRLTLAGFSGIASNKDYAGTAFQLMDNMWQVVKANELKHKGLNIWVYEPHEQLFAGVELYDAPPQETGLEQKEIHLLRYAYYKHTGPYSLLSKVGQNMRDALRRQGIAVTAPYLEIYGHWTADESKLETELLMGIL